MFDRELNQAWEKITPSSELKQKILQMCVDSPKSAPKQSKVMFLKPFMAMAACLMLLFGSAGITANRQRAYQAELLLPDGSEVGKQMMAVFPEEVNIAVSPMIARAMPSESDVLMEQTVVAIPLQISSKESVSLTVEEATLFVELVEDGLTTYVPIGQSGIDLESGTKILWVLPRSEFDEEYIMTMGQDHICVTYHAQTNEYLIFRRHVNN